MSEQAMPMPWHRRQEIRLLLGLEKSTVTVALAKELLDEVENLTAELLERHEVMRQQRTAARELAEARARVAALEGALEASKIRHAHIEDDPWYSCPVALRENDETHLQCDRECDCPCSCGAQEHNVRIDTALNARPEPAEPVAREA